MTAHTTPSQPDSSLLIRVFGPLTDRQTYLNLTYLLLRFPLGIAYFTVFLTGFLLGGVLLITVVGLPILGLTLGLATYVATFEARLTRRLLGVEVSYEARDPTAESLVSYLKAVVTNPRNYLLVGYFFATFGIGIGLFVLLTLLVTVAGALAVAPLTYWLPWVQYQFGLTDVVSTGRVVIDTLPEALVASVVGMTLFTVSVHIWNLLARVLGRLTQVVLS
jgi:hypothetical protein